MNAVTRIGTAAGCLVLALLLAACGRTVPEEPEADQAGTPPPEKIEAIHTNKPQEEEVYMEITITAGETVLEGVLFDNETARTLSTMLPLTVELWHPAPGFARAFDLPELIPDAAERTRSYERGGLAYWYEGPSIAIFYSNHLEQTIVSVVTVGRITSDVSIFEEYGGVVTIAEKEE